MDPVDKRMLETYSAPKNVSATTERIYADYASAWSRTSGGARIKPEVLPLIVATANEIDRIRNRMKFLGVKTKSEPETVEA